MRAVKQKMRAMRGGPLMRQRGVALITVLLVFALVAVIATELLHRNQLSLRRVANQVDTRQAYYYALAGEAYARQLLARDVISGKGNVDTLLEPWAQTAEQQPFEIEGAELRVEISDLQGRFNLNSVTDDAGVVSPDRAAQLAQLLSALQLNPNYAGEWVDWIDRDQQPSPNGAEDGDYADYLTAGRPEADVSALRSLRSMQPADYAKLAPHVVALPLGTTSMNVPINVNTADAAVLRSLSPTISDSQAAQLIAQQKSSGFRDTDAFMKVIGSTQTISAPIAVNSDYFEVLVTVKYGNHWQRLRTQLRREKGVNGKVVSFAVISRVRSPLIDDIE